LVGGERKAKVTKSKPGRPIQFAGERFPNKRTRGREEWQSPYDFCSRPNLQWLHSSQLILMKAKTGVPNHEKSMSGGTQAAQLPNTDVMRA